ncbi:MAG: hypothetical protein ACWA5U_01805 [bacterium]
MRYLHNKKRMGSVHTDRYLLGLVIMSLISLSPTLADEALDLPCDQMFYKAATTCDFEGVAEANAMIACLSLKLANSGCELEIQQLAEVDECGLGCAPVWVVPEQQEEAALQADSAEQHTTDSTHNKDQVAHKQAP